MIPKLIKFCKGKQQELYLTAVIILVAAISFGLGRLSKNSGRKNAHYHRKCRDINEDNRQVVELKVVTNKLEQNLGTASRQLESL